MSAIDSATIRAFLVPLVVFIGLPPLLLFLVLLFGDAHGVLIFLLMSPLAGAYPFSASFPWY